MNQWRIPCLTTIAVIVLKKNTLKPFVLIVRIGSVSILVVLFMTMKGTKNLPYVPSVVKYMISITTNPLLDYIFL